MIQIFKSLLIKINNFFTIQSRLLNSFHEAKNIQKSVSSVLKEYKDRKYKYNVDI